MKVKFIKDYAFAHRGIRLEYFKAGEEREVLPEVYEAAKYDKAIQLETPKAAEPEPEAAPVKKGKK